MTGAVSSNLFQNQEAVEKTAIPEDSLYTPVKEELEQVPAKIAATKSTPAEELARQVIRAVEGGTSGKLWLAEVSTVMRILTWLLPAWAWVSVFLLFLAGLEADLFVLGPRELLLIPLPGQIEESC